MSDIADDAPRRAARARVRPLARLSWHERLSFLLANRIPRRLATLLMGRISRIESPLLVRPAIAIWRRLDPDLDLTESKQQRFASVHACFTRELKAGARSVDPDPGVVVSPCDGIVVALGAIEGTTLFQAKGFPYTLDELLVDPALVARYRDGVYVTLRLRPGMYHRFHAPCECTVREVLYVAGDTWNVNPIALRCVERLYCRNERAVIDLRLPDPARALALVPVAAILVASIRLEWMPAPFRLTYRGPNRFACDAPFARGEEMGCFEHGSTIVVLADRGFSPCTGVASGARVRMGEPLLRLDGDGGGARGEARL